MSESSYYSNDDSEDNNENKLPCVLVDGISEINFEENNIENIINRQRNGKLEVNQDNHSSDPSTNSLSFVDEEYDYLHDGEWINQNCHVFILSTAGKPIYSLHGSEEKLNTLCGLLQALVSVVQSDDDSIKFITARNIKFIFLVKSPLILVGVNKSTKSEQQILSQLMDVYHQIISIVTLSHMNSIYEKRNNYDLRKLLAGSERLVDSLLSNETRKKKISNNPFVSLTHSVRILPMDLSFRDNITSTIQATCSKIKNLVFAVLLANNKLITLVRMKNYCMHTDDLRIIFNLVECTESFKSAESWTPLCLPKFDTNGFLHAHVSYLADDCEACLLLLSVDSDSFFVLSDAKKNITDKLRRSNCMEAINEGIKNRGIVLKPLGVPDIRHFLYKNKKNTQLLCSEITVPYNRLDQFARLETLYYDLHNRIHRNSRPLKLIYQMREHEIQLAWVTANYELYLIFDPLVEKKSFVIAQVNKLLKFIKKEEDKFFMNSTHIF